MKLPLTLDIASSTWVHILDADGRKVCAIYGDTAVEDGRDLVNAINERAAMKARIAELERLMKKWR